MEREEYNFDWNSCLNEDSQIEDGLEDNECTISTHDRETEKKNEFIQLTDENGAVKLLISEAFTSQWERLNGLSISSSWSMAIENETTNRQPTISNDDVFVISLLGDTGDGKSFLINHLLPSKEKNRPVVVEEIKRNGSTTANVTCYETASLLPESSQTTFLLLDYEGECGSHLPYLLKHLNDQWTQERAERRRKAVSEYFPKLAYTLSNVIILLSRDDFSKFDYIARCYDFAVHATKNLQHNLYKPVLILVQNYSSHSMLQPIKEVSKQFFQIHRRDETKKLQNFFSAVYCMRLPYKTTAVSNATQISNTDQMFSEQIIDLKRLLAYIREQHRKERTLPHISWLDITRVVVDIVSKDRPIMMHMLLRQVLVKDPGDTEQNTVAFLFTMLYSKRDIHSKRWFAFCCNFATSVLARAIAIRFFRNMKYIPDGNLKNMVIREEARVCLNKLWSYLNEFRPCTALYMGHGCSKEKDHPVFCLQHKGVHHEHRTSEEVHGVPLWNTHFLTIPRLWSIRDVWDGEFKSDDPNQETPTLPMHEKFSAQITSYIQAMINSPHALYITLDHLLEQYDVNMDSQCVAYYGPCCFCFQETKVSNQTQKHNATVSNLIHSRNGTVCGECSEQRSVLLRDNSVQKLLPPVQNKDECVICMAAPQIIMFDPCYHQRFCRSCAERIYKQFKQCPLCRTNIVKLITPK